jgi:hypothetical protein
MGSPGNVKKVRGFSQIVHAYHGLIGRYRLLYGIYIMSSMASLAYDLPPMFSVTQDLEIELLDEEKLWEASNSQEWDRLRQERAHQSHNKALWTSKLSLACYLFNPGRLS